MSDDASPEIAKSKVLTPEEIKELQLAARRAFKSPAARRVLVDFLVDELKKDKFYEKKVRKISYRIFN